jgi:glycogen debranching enzyme
MLEAAATFPNHSLPELFAGFPRRRHAAPVPYPFANTPQAWACGAVIYLLETLLNVAISNEQLVVHPRATGSVQVHLHGASFRGQRLDL